MLFLSASALAAPALQLPEDGASVGGTVTFSVQAEQTVRLYAREAIGQTSPFRLVALPDTQFYTTESNLNSNGDLFAVQTDWIANNAEDIGFVTHLGDIVQDWDDATQWKLADAAMSMLDDVVPYGLVVGNHDYPARHPDKAGLGVFDVYFPASRFDKQPWWGEHFPKGTNDNNYQVFTAGGLDFLILHLKFEPDKPVFEWASGVIADHPEHRVIISTHTHLGPDGELWVLQSYDPASLWAELVEPFDNVFLVLSAHVDGEAFRTDYVDERAVHQVLACYQSMPDGGAGRLRLLDFEPDSNRIDVSTYSPWTDTFEEDDDSMFSLDYPMGAFELIGEQDPDKGKVVVEWSVPRSGEYEWYAETESGASEIQTFTADAQPPVILELLTDGLANTGQALISWKTDEPAVGVLIVNGEVAGSSKELTEEKSVELTGMDPTFLLQLEVTDAVGNVGISDEIKVTLGSKKEEPGDSGGEPGDSGGEDGDSGGEPGDSGEIDETGCRGCAQGGGGFPGGGFFVFLLAFWSRARTRGSSSVR